MGRFDRLPGIDSEENTTRRNVLVGGGYALVGVGAIGALGDPGEDEDNEESSNGGDSPAEDSTDGSDSLTDDSSNDSDEDGGDSPTDNSSSDSDEDGDDGSSDGQDEPARSDASELLSISELDSADTPFYDSGRETLSGTGQTVTDEFSIDGGLTTFVFEHDGEANFIVEVYDAELDERIATPINEIGAASGTVALPASGLELYLDVTADGDWSITVAQPLPPAEEVRTPPVEAAGSGSQVVGPVELTGGHTASGTHDGEENFIVEFIPEDAFTGAEGELVFNEIGQFEGETVVSTAEIGWFDVQASGEWTIEVE